jgi:GntR family transcriptional regulator
MNILVDAQLIEKRRGVGMFVITGAQHRIVEKRRDQFYTDYVKKLVTEAQKLHITQAELAKLIERGFSES